MIRVIIWALVTVVILIAAAAGGIYYALGPGEVKADIAKLHQQWSKPPPPPTEDQIVYYTMPEMRADLLPRDPRHELVLFAADLRLHKASDQVYVQNSLPIIIDAFQCYFRDGGASSATQLLDIAQLKREMLARINAIIAPGKIDDILFREMSIQ